MRPLIAGNWKMHGFAPELAEIEAIAASVKAAPSSADLLICLPATLIARAALDIAQVPARHDVYIENAPIFGEIAEGLRIRSILHTDYKSMCVQLAARGLQNAEGTIHETG